MTSVKATAATVMDGQMSACRAFMLRSGMANLGSDELTGPIVGMPSGMPSGMATARATTAPGMRVVNFGMPQAITATSRPTARVLKFGIVHWVSVMSFHRLSVLASMPVSFCSCDITISTAMPVRYPTSTGSDSRSARNAALISRPSTSTMPTMAAMMGSTIAGSIPRRPPPATAAAPSARPWTPGRPTSICACPTGRRPAAG